ncbi:uncharacterized protein DNG_02622 [Cephalotrichum gorgonifer]|uniref:PD-(D/E)XK nuclease-like domain-containing protein n=1 Tax=Cephalotrichum gorgonifer TaxID=2041049 RepID=A0AAE8ST87_9PEZI|nr:uncharacterized protein DNG_02622 [Cephalotrichum gorgonifer]
MAPKKKEVHMQRVTRSQKKRSGDDLVMSRDAPPSKKPLSTTATAASKQSSSTAEALSLLELAGITLIPLNPELLPPDSHSLYSSLSKISSAGSKTIPVNICAHISTKFDPVLDDQILRDYHLSNEAALQELDLLREIVDEAVRCQCEEVLDADWNCTVQSPLFNIAFKDLASTLKVRARNITGATIVPEYVPRMLKTGEPLQSHKVDFCLALEPERTIMDFIDEHHLQSINQTIYNPLRTRPIAMTIETKSQTPHTTGTPQLAIWAYAWFSRIAQIAPNAHTPAMPLLRIVGHEWYVLWAWKDSESPLRMTVTSDLALGHTRNLHGVYKILASLRRLVKWIEEVFQPWAAERFQ